MQNDIFEQANAPGTGRQAISVSELNRRVKDLLEVHLPLLWVEGEISNFSAPASGHWYFTLKDERAQVRCAMFRGRNQRVGFRPKAGDKVLVRARVSLYEGRGDYQLIAEHLEESGFGLLQQRFEALKAQLHAEGLFDDAHKRPLPALPKHIAVITSPTGAAIRDVLSVLKRRFPAIPVTIIPSPVQGEEAPARLIRALDMAEQQGRFDVVLLCRGGGSIEDLWGFNSEALARRIHQCALPVVSAVGHEVDFTIADFVADRRAPTPSAAAELLSPAADALSAQFTQLRSQLVNRWHALLQQRQQQLIHLRQRLKHPGERLNNWAQRLDHLEARLGSAMARVTTDKRNQLARLQQSLDHFHPRERILLRQRELAGLSERLDRAARQQLSRQRDRLSRTVALLELASPLATLKRGYAIARDEQGQVVRSAGAVKGGDTLRLTLADGDIHTTVNKHGN